MAKEAQSENLGTRWPLEMRLETASRILAGFAANPAVFASNPQCGWSLVNCTEPQLVRLAISLADIAIAELHKSYTT